MSWIGVLLPLILTFLAGPLSKGDNDPVTDVNSELLKSRKNITKREAGCPKGQQRAGQFCCLPCLPGEKKSHDCTTDGGKLVCVPCLEGEEYTDSEHYVEQCRRCGICDGEQGLEVEKNCTKTQNTKCRCKSNFFCNTPPCGHCNPCSTCEYGVDEKCTPTNNTRCRKGKKKLCCNNSGPYEITRPDTEMIHMDLVDVDLDDYICTIAEQMKINEVKDFVRKNGINEAKIDDIKNDDLQNIAEQKVQLLRTWYQYHGKKDALLTLIEGLKKANLCRLAEKIQDINQKRHY